MSAGTPHSGAPAPHVPTLPPIRTGPKPARSPQIAGIMYGLATTRGTPFWSPPGWVSSLAWVGCRRGGTDGDWADDRLPVGRSKCRYVRRCGVLRLNNPVLLEEAAPAIDTLSGEVEGVDCRGLWCSPVHFYGHRGSG